MPLPKPTQINPVIIYRINIFSAMKKLLLRIPKSFYSLIGKRFLFQIFSHLIEKHESNSFPLPAVLPLQD